MAPSTRTYLMNKRIDNPLKCLTKKVQEEAEMKETKDPS